MKDATILKTGVVGSVIAAVCCATPVGHRARRNRPVGLVGWLDYVLFPALAVFLALTAYGLWRRQCAAACCATDNKTNNERS